MRRFWDTEELAKVLGVSVSWIYDRTRSGGPEGIPHFKLGKYIRFNPESQAFQRWLASHEVCSGDHCPPLRRSITKHLEPG